jgi:hypothetical protein
MRGFAPILVAALVAVTVLSGCTSSGGSDSSSGLENAARSLDVQGSETTGVIRGIVVDTGIHPLAQATVSIKVGATTLTNKTNGDGAFGFSKVVPGTYFVDVKKSGYKSTQQSVEVKANDNNPPIVKVLLEVDAGFQKPSHDTFHFRGFLACNVAVPLFFFPCEVPLTGIKIDPSDNFAASFPISGNVTWIHTSLVWTPTEPVGTELYFNVFPAQGDDSTTCNPGCYTGGPSPLTLDINKTKDLQPFADSGLVNIDVSGNGEQGIAGAELQQPFDVYMVVFHGYKPPAGYAFYKDGEPKDPK